MFCSVCVAVIVRSGAVTQKKKKVQKTRRKRGEVEKELGNQNLQQMKEIRNVKRRVTEITRENRSRRGKT
jgi:membrane protein involved in colicin uptake